MPRPNTSSSSEPDLDSYEGDGFDSPVASSGEQLRQLIHDLLGRWYWAAFGLILGILVGVYYLSKAPKLYSATSTLLVKQAVSNVVSNDGEEEELALGSTEALNTVAQQIGRTALLSRVARDPKVRALQGLVPKKVNWLPEWEDQYQWKEPSKGGPGEGTATAGDLDDIVLGEKIGSWMKVKVRKGTRLLDVSVSHPVPECAQVLANAIAENYVEEMGSNRADGRGSATKILEEKSQEAMEHLQTREGALANYEQILELLADHKEKELVFSELDRRYLPKHPKWIKAREALDRSEKRFLSEFVLIRKAPTDQAYWEKNRAEWDQPDLDQASRILVARRLLTARATLLQSEIKTQREIYDDLLTRYRANLASASVVEAEIESSNPAKLPKTPSSPKPAMVLPAGGLAGLILGIALAYLLVKLDTKIHSVEQLELMVDLPVLATIHNTPPKFLEKIIAEKEGGSNPSSPASWRWDPRVVFRPGLTQTIYAEMYRVLRASVSLLGDEKKRRVTLFSSGLPGDGKTLVSTNFAFASASQGKKTILVDLDLRKPSVHKNFGLKRGELGDGVTEVLAGKTSWREAAVESPGHDNLTCLFSGAKAPNPGELLDNEGIEELLANLREEFEVVVVDSAPILAVSDTRLLIPYVDNFCLVIRAEQTPKGAVRKVVEFLQDDGLTPSGVVLNAYVERTSRFSRKSYGYGGYGQYGKGYGYGGYGAYGSDDDDD